MSHLMLLGLSLENVGAIIMTAVGLGGLIFFHELGHFLACRVTGGPPRRLHVGRHRTHRDLRGSVSDTRQDLAGFERWR